MTHTKLRMTLCFALLLCGIVFYACKKVDENTPPPPGITSGDADEIAARLLFLSSTKKQGSPPAASGSNSLKISFEDTFYLVDELYRPINFLHLDKSKNVAGAFLQIIIGGSGSSFYYDVPELKQMSDNDSVSVVMVGLDPTNLNPPIDGEIKIIPYDSQKQPIGQFLRPLKVVKNEGTNLPNGDCGLQLPPDKEWHWMCSFVGESPNVDSFKFYNSPSKVHGSQGQMITGACCNGKSQYPQKCQGDTAGIFDRQLHFATYYQINFELFEFFNSGVFKRVTSEDTPFPQPTQSNFCAGGEGVILDIKKDITADGRWTITPATIPANAPAWLKRATQQLTLQQISTTPPGSTSFGNPGGVIHQLDCKRGVLILVQLDREGFGNHLIKYYFSYKKGSVTWYD